MINIFDGNNYGRREMENSLDGLVPRDLFIKFSAAPGANVIVWDGSNGNARHRKIYSRYKVRDNEPDREIYSNFEFVRDVLKHSCAIQVRLDDYEADDVIAALARRYAGQGEEVAIYSRDADFLQLAAEFPNRIFCGAAVKPAVPVELIRYYKVCVGDKSDKIPGIHMFGDRAWQKIDKKELTAWVDAAIATGRLSKLRGMPRCCKPSARSIRTFWKLVNFIDVPIDEIDAATMVGDANPAARAALLEEFMQ